MSQVEKIRKHLKDSGKIDPMTALSCYGCMRLAARIADLRDSGMHIVTEIKSRDGKRWAVYHYEEGDRSLINDDRYIYEQPVSLTDQKPVMPSINEEILTSTNYVTAIPAMIGRLVLAGCHIPSAIKYYSYDRGYDVPFEYWGSIDMVHDAYALTQTLNDISPDGCYFGWLDDVLGWWPIKEDGDE